MKVALACPACGRRFEADAAHAGRSTRCQQCGGPVVVPGEPGWEALSTPKPAGPGKPNRFDDEEEGDTYDLGASPGAAPPPVFVPARAKGDPAPPGESDRRRRRKPTRRRAPAGDAAWFRPKALLAAAGLLGLFLLGAVLVPGGADLAGGALTIVGVLVFLAAFLLGAYVAWAEDALHGFLFVVLPIYTAYYIASNWDEMWPSMAGMFLGVVLIGLGGMVAGAPEADTPDPQASRPPAAVRVLA